MARTSRVTADEFTVAIADMMQEIDDDITAKVFSAVDEAAERCNETAKQYLREKHGAKTGKYRDSFAIDKETPSKRRRKATWYVRAPRYRLTHLLEKGHKTRNKKKSTRTKKIKHIEHGEEIAKQVLEEKLKKLTEL